MSHLRDIAIIGLIIYVVFTAFSPGNDGGPPEGQPAPDIQASLMSGGTFTLSEHSGKVVILDFWSTTCGPCRRSLPALQTVYEKVKDGGEVEIVSVSLDKGNRQQNPADVVTRYMKKNTLSFPVILDLQNALASAYTVESIPTMVIIGPDGQVKHTAVGLYTTNHERLVQHIEQLIKQAQDS